MDLSESKAIRRGKSHMTRDTITATIQWASTELDTQMREVETAKDTDKRHDCNDYK